MFMLDIYGEIYSNLDNHNNGYMYILAYAS